MENCLDKKYELRYFEMDKHGTLAPTTVLTLLEETAAEHCHNIGYSLHDLERRNIGWVLVSGTIDMLRYPRYKENIEIRTWISKYTLVKGYRENIIYDESGAVIGKARGVWVFYDIDKKKPVPIFDEIKSKWGVNAKVSQEPGAGAGADAISVISGDVAHQLEYDVHKSDVDSNKHVNNIRYFHWLIESMPDDFSRDYALRRLNGKFYSEARYGEKIRVCVEGGAGRGVFSHTMRSSLDNRLLAAARTVWEEK